MIEKNSSKHGIILFKKTPLNFLIGLIKAKLLSLLTKRAMTAFVRGGDVISIGPLGFGSHEPHVAAAIKYFAECGYNDFLIDIGANIGLTSSQCGNSFKFLYAYEPNPLCHGVLETNLALNVKREKYEVRKFGLGRENQIMMLKIPRHNWGGAHIATVDNSYSKDLLLTKDGFKKDTIQDYIELEIDIRSADEELTELFSIIQKNESKFGVIKIDVEVFEPLILESIARTLPEHLGVYIVFENLGGQLLVDKLPTILSKASEIFCLEKSIKGNNAVSKIFNLVATGGYSYTLQKFNEDRISADMIIHLPIRSH
jgi:FkbM family methyltransferase